MSSSSELPKGLSEDSLASVDEPLTERRKSDTLESYEMPSDIEEVEVEGSKEESTDEWMDIIGSGDIKKKVTHCD